MKNSTKKTLSKKSLSPINQKVAGIDIGANSIFVCISLKGKWEVREYLTFTVDLKAMAKWLRTHKITSVAMESTGVYWIPVFDILEKSGFEVLLVNAHHVKNVPGRKTDVKDCQWIQQLHSYGLLRASFRPTQEILPLRAFVRLRSRLFESASVQIQLMHKALTQMNIKLRPVLNDITGETGMKIIKSIVAGERDPKKLASYRNYRCKKSEDEIAKALEGNFLKEHLFALKQSLNAYEFFQAQILECEQNIKETLKSLHKKNESESIERVKKNFSKSKKKTASNRSPYYFEAGISVEKAIGVNLLEIPGMDAPTIIKILSEIGTDMTRWPTVKHFTSWLALCPGNKISGGKVLSSRTKPTNNRAAQALRMAANSLYKSQSALGAFFRRMRARLGAPKAITAAAHKIAKILYIMLRDKKSFQEIGEHYYENRYRKRVLSSLIKKAEVFGYHLVEN